MKTFWSMMSKVSVMLLLIYALSQVGCGEGCDCEVHIKTSQLPNGAVGKPYSLSLEAVDKDNNLADAQWSLASGLLPPGLSMSGEGVISGTPTTAGTYDFSVKAKLLSCIFETNSDTKTLTLKIVIQNSER